MTDTTEPAEESETAIKERILIVDDDPGIRDTLSTILAEQGFETLTAEDGIQACALLDSGPLLCVLTDINDAQHDWH